MDQYVNNVGGDAAGTANGTPGQPQHVPAMPPMAGAPAGGPAPYLYAGQSNPAVPQAGSVGSQSMLTDMQPGANQNNNSVSTTTAPIAAEDSDLIEKEWVEKAEAIVEKTRRDPFLQSQELNNFKAEYLQKRYGKNVGSDGQ